MASQTPLMRAELKAGLKPEFNLAKGSGSLKGLTGDESFLVLTEAIGLFEIVDISERREITLGAEGMAPKRFGDKWFRKNTPEVGGYLLLQRNGRIRYIPERLKQIREDLIKAAWEASLYID